MEEDKGVAEEEVDKDKEVEEEQATPWEEGVEEIGPRDSEELFLRKHCCVCFHFGPEFCVSGLILSLSVDVTRICGSEPLFQKQHQRCG